jgi:hypothetical protein
MREEYANLKQREQDVLTKYEKLKSREKTQQDREDALNKREEQARRLKLKITEETMALKTGMMLTTLKRKEQSGSHLNSVDQSKSNIGPEFFLK